MTSIDHFDADPDVGRRRRRPPPAIARKEVTAMNQLMNNYVVFAVHAERVGRYRAEAEAERLRRESAIDRRFRRAVGRSLVRFGERLAAEADERFEPVASR